ncbi:MAG: hypothetical protein V3S55_09520 [Nitrospiraceae bacterium]
MRGTFRPLCVILVLSACFVSLSVWLGPTEASAQNRITDEQQRTFALKEIAHQLRKQTEMAENERRHQERILEDQRRFKTSTQQPGRAVAPALPKRWATDMEIDRQGRLRTYYILWSDGSVTNGGTLP